MRGRLVTVAPSRLTNALKKKVLALQKQLLQPQAVPPPASAEAQAPDEQYDDDHEAEDDAEGGGATGTGDAAEVRGDDGAGQDSGDDVKDNGGGAQVVDGDGGVEESMDEEDVGSTRRESSGSRRKYSLSRTGSVKVGSGSM